MNKYKQLDRCLCCNSAQLKPVLDLGDQPLANTYKSSPIQVVDVYPLKLMLCEACMHCQLSIAVNPTELFSEYLYVSGTTNTLREYFDWFAKFVIAAQGEVPKSVMDIGCNDGSQLDAFAKLGVEYTIGIDPAVNLYKFSSKKGHHIDNAYFDMTYEPGKWNDDLKVVDCIIAQNVFAHNSDPIGFLKEAAKYLEPEVGKLFIQVSQVEMIQRNEFDTIYHEHISFFNIHSMLTLIKRSGLFSLEDVIKTPIHGTSYIFVIKRTNTPSDECSRRITEEMKRERSLGIYSTTTYINYAEAVKFNIEQLNMLLQQTTQKIIGYGAAAKGMTLLNALDPSAVKKIQYIIDDNELKQLKYTAGANIPIVSIYGLYGEHEENSIAFIPLAWNFFDEIKQRIKAIRPNTAKDVYIKYFPKVTIE